MTKKEILLFLKKHGAQSNIEKMRYFGIVTPKAFGVTAPVLRKLAKEIGTDHHLAQSLWKTEHHEARVLAALIADPDEVTEALMETGVNDFNSWAICDACCGELFDDTPLAIKKAYEWSKCEKEYVKRAGFVMMAMLALHRKDLDDSVFQSFFPIIERNSTDDRNFVRKGVNWALRELGKRNMKLHRDAMRMAKKLSQSKNSTARWIGRDAVKDLQSKPAQRRLERSTAKLLKRLKS